MITHEVIPCFPTCYYCGAPATSREHVPPQVFLKQVPDISRHQALTVPSCKRHNEEKAQLDQAVYNAFALPLYHMLGTRWEKMPAHMRTTLRAKSKNFAHQKQITNAVPLVGPELDSAPLYLTHSTLDWTAWTRMLTAGLWYVICGCHRPEIDWDESEVIHWDFFAGAKMDVVHTDMLAEAFVSRNATYAQVAPEIWHDATVFGHHTLPAEYYTYRISKTGAVWVVEHRFFGQYRVWCAVVLPEAQAEQVMRLVGDGS